MASVNMAIIMGNLGRDPELRWTNSGKAVANVSVATSERWGKGEDKKEKTEWHKVVFFGKTAEIAGEYLSKGDTCHIVGRIETRKWQDKQGNDKYTTEIVGKELTFVGKRADKGGGKVDRTDNRKLSESDKFQRPPDEDDDIPF